MINSFNLFDLFNIFTHLRINYLTGGGKMKKSALKSVCLSVFLLLCLIYIPLFAQEIDDSAETITLVTYYPAPIGVYSDLRAKKMAIGEEYYNPETHCFDDGTGNCDPTEQAVIPSEADLVVQGNVGIGTTSPVEMLHIENNHDDNTEIVIGNNSNTAHASVGIRARSADSEISIGALPSNNTNYPFCADRAFIMSGVASLGLLDTAGLSLGATKSDADMRFYTGGYAVANERIRIDSSGNVGIGTTDPKAQLHVNSDTTQGMVSISGVSDSSSTYSALYLHDDSADNDSNWVLAHKNMQGAAGENDFWIGYWENSSSMHTNFVIDSETGNVGIGTTNPEATLDVYTGPVYIGRDSGGKPGMTLGESSAVGTKPDIRFDAQGLIAAYSNIFINIDSDNNKANNGIYFMHDADTIAGETIAYIVENGNMWLKGTLEENSDIRLKKNIHSVDSSLTQIAKMNPVTFEWKNPGYPSGRQIGLIAQEIETIYPEVVSTNQETGYKSIAYTKLIPILIQAVKELSTENDFFKKELEKQNENIKNIEQKMNK